MLGQGGVEAEGSTPASPAMTPLREESAFDKLAAWVDETIQRPFRVIGEVNGTSPRRVMSGSALLCVLFMAGLSQMSNVTESRSDKLWFPQDTQTQKDKKAYEANFPRSGAVSTIIVESRGSNLLTSDALSDLMTLHESITSMTTSNGDSLADLCVSASYVSGTTCYQQNILAAFYYSSTKLASDPSPVKTINDYFTSTELETMLGKVTYSSAGEPETAKALKVIYYLEDDTEVVNGAYINEDNDLWEEDFLSKVEKAKSSEVKYYAMATRSWSDVFGEAIRGDIVLMNIAYYIMIIYMSINLGRLPCRGECPNPESRVLLALSSVLAILLSMGSAFGFCALAGFIWSPVHSVLPFVILGLGVDDSFVIVNAFDQTNRNEPIPMRMRKALAHAATSITVTSLTDFVAFAISTSSALPALSSFCMYAAMAILFLFMMQITFFSAAVCLDEERQQARHTDCCPCCTKSCVSCCTALPCCRLAEEAGTTEGPEGQVTAPSQAKQGTISKFMETKLAPVIIHPKARIFIVAAFVLLLAACCSLGIPNLTVEDNERSFITDGSYLLKTLEKDDKFFGDEGEVMYVVTKDVDYYAKQSDLTTIKSDVDGIKALRDPYTTDSFESWYEEFVSYCSSNSLTGYDSNEATFYSYLSTFLSSASGSYLSSSVVFDGSSSITASRIKTQFKPMSTYTDGRRRQDAGKVVDAMEAARSTDWAVEGAYPWSYTFTKWETFKIIEEELFQNIILCLVAVLIITTLLIGHPGCSGLVFVCVTMTVLDILGCMHFWGKCSHLE